MMSKLRLEEGAGDGQVMEGVEKLHGIVDVTRGERYQGFLNE